MAGFTVYYLMMKKEDEGIRMKILSSWDLNGASSLPSWTTLWAHYDKKFVWQVFDYIAKDVFVDTTDGLVVFLPMREVLHRRDELDKKIDILKALEDICLFIGEICNITPRYTRWKDQ